LSQRYDPTWPLFDSVFEGNPGNPVITGQRDQFLDVLIRVIPQLH